MNIETWNTTRLEYIYGVANTPMFIVRKFKTDPLVIGISQQNSANDILAELTASLANAPTTARERIIPFALLVALSLKADRRVVESAIELPCAGYRWYKLVGETLLQSMTNVTRGTIVTKIVQPVIDKTVTSRAANNRHELLIN